MDFFKKKLNSPISRRQPVLRSFSEVEGYGEQVALVWFFILFPVVIFKNSTEPREMVRQ